MASDRTKSTENAARLQEQIDVNLRRTYDETLNEALPDRFLDLISQLKAKDGEHKHGK